MYEAKEESRDLGLGTESVVDEVVRVDADGVRMAFLGMACSGLSGAVSAISEEEYLVWWDLAVWNGASREGLIWLAASTSTDSLFTSRRSVTIPSRGETNAVAVGSNWALIVPMEPGVLVVMDGSRECAATVAARVEPSRPSAASATGTSCC